MIPVFTDGFSEITLFEEFSRVKVTSGVHAFQMTSFNTHFFAVILLVFGKNICINLLIIRRRVNCVCQECWADSAGLLACTPSNSSTARLTRKIVVDMPKASAD